MEPPRRSFLYKIFTISVGAILPLPAIAAALGSLMNPLRREVRLQQAPSGSVPIGKDVGYFETLTKGKLKESGSDPQRISIIADRKDAWNVYPKSQIGAVYVQKISDERLAFEQDPAWVAEKTLQAKVNAAPTDKQADLLKELLEVELYRLKRDKEQLELKDWTPKDTEKATATYTNLFQAHQSVVEAVASKSTWEGALRVFNTSCPHAGCAVDYKKDEGGKPGYFCPCHDSVFAMDGAQSQNSPSPRGLDRLRYGYVGDSVCVKFQNFQAGHAEKKPS